MRVAEKTDLFYFVLFFLLKTQSEFFFNYDILFCFYNKIFKCSYEIERIVVYKI